MEGPLPVNLAVFGRELNGQFVPGKGGVHVGCVAVVVIRGEDQTTAGKGEGSHFFVGLVDVPVLGQISIGEVQIKLDGRVATVPARELEGVVVQTVNADLPTSVLGLMPEVGHHDAGPFTVADGGADGPDDFDLPRAVVEGLRDTVVTPCPLSLRFVVKDGVKFVEFEIATDVREPRHGDDVPVGGLHDAPLAQPFLAGVGWDKGTALLVGERRGNVGVPEVATIGGKDRVFATDVENLTVDVGGEVVFATVSTVRGIEDSPRGVRRLVGSQVHRHEGPLDLVRLHVNAFV